MATATKSTAALDSAQREWLKKMGSALDARATDAGAGEKTRLALGPEDLIDPLKNFFDPHSCQVRVVNDSGRPLKLDSLSVREVDDENQIGISHGKYESMPPDPLAANGSGEFKASSNTDPILGKTLTGVEGRVRYFLDDQKTAWIIHFNNPFKGKNTADVLLDGPNKAQFESPKPTAGNGNDAVYLFTLKKKGTDPGPPGPGPTPGVDAASSCHVTITNNTKLTLTLGNQGHERGDFMTFPATTLAPGATTTCVSVETPNNKDPKDEGCKGFLLWQVGSPSVLWRVEWDNPEQQKNTALADFNPRNAGFNSLNQIGQGEENVPVSFTISGDGGVTPPPPGTQSKLLITVTDAKSSQPIEGATIEIASQSLKSDKAGKASADLPPGVHAFKATEAKHHDKSGHVEMKAGQDTPLDISMEPKAAAGSLDVTVVERGTEKPIAGAVVDVSGNKKETDAKGQADFDVPPGKHPFKVTADGFQENKGTVDVAEEKKSLRIELDKAAEVVFNPPPESKQPTLRKGDKSADGWVEYLQKLLNKYLGAGTVPEDGNFEQKTFDAVKKFQASTKPPCLVDGIVGNETWSMLRKGDREAVGVNEQDDEKGVEGRWATEKNDFVTYDATSDELRMVAVSVGDAPIDKHKATFRITSADKKVQKTFEKVLGAPTGPSPTGAGQFHTVVVEQMSATYGNGDVAVEAYLEEKLGGDLWKGTVNINGTAPPPGGKTGDIGFTVTNEKTGAPVAGAKVSLAGVSKATDAAGIALFEKAPAGKHKFTVTHKDFESASDEAEVLADASTPKAVKLKPKSSPPPGGKVGTIGFKVSDAKSGKPVAEAKVSLGSLSKTTDASGIAVFAKAPAGKHPFTASHKDFESDSGEVEVLPDTSTPKAVKLKPKTSPPSGVTGSIGFTVTDKATTKPVAGATVNVAGQSKTTDATGTAIFDDVAEASYPYTVTHPSYKTENGGVEVEANTSKAEQVKLQPSTSPPGTGGTVGFMVKDEKTGMSISGAIVTVAGQTKTTEFGVATFEGLAPASYPYTVTHPSYESASNGVDVEDNTSTSEEVKLKPKSAPPSGLTGSVGFSVTDQSNKPISGAAVNVAGRSATTDASGSANFDDLAPASYSYTVSHSSYQTANGGVDVEANQSRSESVQLKAVSRDDPPPKKTDDGPSGGDAPPEHRLVKKQTFTHKVNLKDTNYGNEELGHWLLRMEVGLSGTGQVYPLHVDLVPKLKNPANNIINIFPTIKAKSENLNGARSCDITFNVQVAGPNVSSQSGGKFGGSIGWKDATERLEAGLSAEWTVTESHSSQAGGAWSRRFHISGGDVLGFSQDSSWKEDLTGDMVIDDDHGHDDWGVDTDWELHTYDG